MANNILNEGREVLLKIYEEVKELGQSELREKELTEAEDNAEKILAEKEKSVAKEIMDITKKRREEIAQTFDAEEDKLNEIAKKTSQKREKYRDVKVSERIQIETADFIEANKQIKSDTKKLYKQNKTPGFFNSEFYYTLFMPGSIRDFLYCILSFAILFGGIYMLIFTTSRNKYIEVVNMGNNARNKIKNNKRVIAKISKKIRKDKDDTHYGLENYNAKLEDIKIQLEDLMEKRKEALRVFDDSTRQAVADEIKNGAQAEIDGYKTRLTELAANLSEIRDYIKQRKIYIAENYEAFLGKELVDADTLKALLEISDKNPAATISELIELYKQPVSEN